VKLPLERCANGCDAPPQHPSLVLCKKCLDALDVKMHKVLGKVPEGVDRD
jgi:hypothetical protein